MAKKEETKDIRVLRKTVFTEEQLTRKENRKKTSSCPYKIRHQWDPEKGKYVKVKVYKKRTKMNRKELEEFFGHKWTKVSTRHESEARKSESANAAVKTGSNKHPKTAPARKQTSIIRMGSIKYEWDSKALRYKIAA